MSTEGKYAISTSTKSARKYPNVIWFPRSKTDPREIREVLKIARKTQTENPESYFNDKLLGVKMAEIGSIKVIGLDGQGYIDSYQDKSTGNVSFITNARMLMRLFRFLGLVRRIAKGKYVLTELGELYTSFAGDFPDYKNGMSEEKVLLDSLANFSFYSVGDDSAYRDSKFRIRPFLWLLRNLEIEPQCIFQLIVTAFASQNEGPEEEARIRGILNNLRAGTTTLKDEWARVGLDADDYSCVHNFYDSVKILVYLGMSLGLIAKTADAAYGKKISGGARHLKQATTFYTLTEKGRKFLEASLPSRLVYYDEIYSHFGDESSIQVAFLLASLNYKAGNRSVVRVHRDFYTGIENLDELMAQIENRLGILIEAEDGHLSLRKPIAFSFFQQMPPEIMAIEPMTTLYNSFMHELGKNGLIELAEDISSPSTEHDTLVPFFGLDSTRQYVPPKSSEEILEQAIRYPGMEDVFGGADRFSGRVSPTNSVIVSEGKLLVDPAHDALDLLVPLRLGDPALAEFVKENTSDLLEAFLERSDNWEKDQHYTWVRNVCRHFGMEALYSGSGGMLSRADVSILKPFFGGIEAKSPRENRGTLNTKAIRQAVDAKIQVADKGEEDTAAVAVAIGRRISDQAVSEEKKWAKQGQPVLLIHDAALHYIVLKSAVTPLSMESLTRFFTENHGPVTATMIRVLIEKNTQDITLLAEVDAELEKLTKYVDA